MNSHQNDFEIDSLKALRKEGNPPPELEERIIDSLKKAGFIRPGRSSISTTWLLAAAIAFALLLGAAFYLGEKHAKPQAGQPSHPLFVLFLYEKQPVPVQDSHVTEYSNWIRSIRASGRHASGEKLKNDGRVLQLLGQNLRVQGEPLHPQNMLLAGYFLIEATGYEEALRIASNCPHLKYGGTIELREIDSI
jgi:hypothetical protein